MMLSRVFSFRKILIEDFSYEILPNIQTFNLLNMTSNTLYILRVQILLARESLSPNTYLYENTIEIMYLKYVTLIWFRALGDYIF